ncbi:hypothetical protein ES708_17725 [subsurface metagenome]
MVVALVAKGVIYGRRCLPIALNPLLKNLIVSHLHEISYGVSLQPSNNRPNPYPTTDDGIGL